MWCLETVNEIILQDYEDLLFGSLKNSVNTSDDPIRNILTPIVGRSRNYDNLKRLLRLKPIELYNLSNSLMNHLIPNYDDNEFESFLTAKNKKEENRTQHEEVIYNKYNEVLKKLRLIFNYDSKISNSKSKSYKIASMKARNSCTYCNRQYTQNIVKDEGTNSKNRITRPQLDHWFSQELFPLMSLSFYNLIPSCSICNSGAKGNIIFRFGTHIHPYLDKYENINFKFEYTPSINNTWGVKIDRVSNSREDNMIIDFKLEEIYNYHSDLELQDIMDFKIGYNDTYLNTLLNQMLFRFSDKSIEDIYRMFFGTEALKSKYLDRPMSKFKYDILKKLGVIDRLEL